MNGAVQFLLNAQSPRGYWRDFQLAPGCSDEWVTAYVGNALAISTVPNSTVPNSTAAATQIRRSRFKAWNWLAERWQMSAPGWGYNALTPKDADSTLWALTFAASLGCEGWAAAKASQAFLRAHICADGGLTTYATETDIRRFIGAADEISFVGWCRAHVCVTAAAAQLTPFRFTACDFLRQQQQQAGHWQSYWWCEDEYATALAAEALAKGLERGDRTRVQRAIEWVEARMNSTGAVSSTIMPSGSPFATALAIRILLLTSSLAEVRMPLIKAIQWLLNQQNADGTWVASAGLQVPPPDCTDPSRFTGWTVGDLREGAISLDQQRLFTTATVLQTLQKVLLSEVDIYREIPHAK